MRCDLDRRRTRTCNLNSIQLSQPAGTENKARRKTQEREGKKQKNEINRGNSETKVLTEKEVGQDTALQMLAKNKKRQALLSGKKSKKRNLQKDESVDIKRGGSYGFRCWRKTKKRQELLSGKIAHRKVLTKKVG